MTVAGLQVILAETERRLEQAERERDQLRERLAPFLAECEAVGIPEDAPGLVRHHHGNASLAAQAGLSGDTFQLVKETHRLVRLLAEEAGVIPEDLPAGGPA